ncbi:MAG: hypothetical protein ACOX4J_10355 [Anaerovoracaceae bacterium]
MGDQVAEAEDQVAEAEDQVAEAEDQVAEVGDQVAEELAGPGDGKGRNFMERVDYVSGS